MGKSYLCPYQAHLNGKFIIGVKSIKQAKQYIGLKFDDEKITYIDLFPQTAQAKKTVINYDYIHIDIIQVVKKRIGENIYERF